MNCRDFGGKFFIAEPAVHPLLRHRRRMRVMEFLAE
jgi:hypothetical protein